MNGTPAPPSNRVPQVSQQAVAVPTELALASVTALLKDLLENAMAAARVAAQLGADATVSSQPPDRISTGAEEKAQINLFLFHLTPRTALRSTGDGRRDRPLEFELHYLLTAYGPQDLQAELLLGHALRVLGEHSSVAEDRIRSTFSGWSEGRGRRHMPPTVASLATSDLAKRITSLTIYPEFVPADDMFKLWSACQARYRPSAVYKVRLTIDDQGGPR